MIRVEWRRSNEHPWETKTGLSNVYAAKRWAGLVIRGRLHGKQFDFRIYEDGNLVWINGQAEGLRMRWELAA